VLGACTAHTYRERGSELLWAVWYLSFGGQGVRIRILRFPEPICDIILFTADLLSFFRFKGQRKFRNLLVHICPLLQQHLNNLLGLNIALPDYPLLPV